MGVFDLLKSGLAVKKAASAIASPVAAVRDATRQFVIKQAVKGIVAVAGKVVSEEKLNAVAQWEKTIEFNIPADNSVLNWAHDPENLNTVLATINELLQVPLLAYGVTPAQINAQLTEDKQLKFAIVLKVHKNSELK